MIESIHNKLLTSAKEAEKLYYRLVLLIGPAESGKTTVLNTITKKLKLFRLEAVRAGFKKAWQEKEYDTIISVAEKIPNKILEEDPKLLMWYDQAITRTGDR